MITIDSAATNQPFRIWDYCTQRFVTAPEEYTVFIGTSANDTSRASPLTLLCTGGHAGLHPASEITPLTVSQVTPRCTAQAGWLNLCDDTV